MDRQLNGPAINEVCTRIRCVVTRFDMHHVVSACGFPIALSPLEIAIRENVRDVMRVREEKLIMKHITRDNFNRMAHSL